MNNRRFTYSDKDILQAQQNTSKQAAKRFVRTHVSPVDERHQIEVWTDTLNPDNRYYMPMYSRTGRSWASYTSHGQRVACTSYASAMKYIPRARETQPNVLQSAWVTYDDFDPRPRTVAQQDKTGLVW